MLDIVRVSNGEDLGMFSTDVERAKNILSTQEGELYYVPEDFGIDLKFFLSEEFEFQNESFKAYLVQRLASQSVNVSGVVEVIESLYNRLVFSIGTNRESGSMVR